MVMSDRTARSTACAAASAGASSSCDMKSRRRGKLAPVTSTTPGRAAITRRAAIVQLPAGRSVKITRMLRESTSSSIARSISAAPIPVFVMGRKSSPLPVICSTAVTKPVARSPCVAMIATGAPSFIIFLEVLPDGRRLRRLHALHESLVEGFGGVHPAVSQQVIHRHDFGHDGDVFPRIERDHHLGNLHTEDRRRRAIETRPIDGGRLVPLLELHDDLDALLLPNGPYAEDRLHVDQPDATNLHVMACKLVAAADQDVVATTCGNDEVIG